MVECSVMCANYCTGTYGTHQLQLKWDTRGTRRGYTRVAHACFCHIHAITHTINYLRV